MQRPEVGQFLGECLRLQRVLLLQAMAQQRERVGEGLRITAHQQLTLSGISDQRQGQLQRRRDDQQERILSIAVLKRQSLEVRALLERRLPTGGRKRRLTRCETVEALRSPDPSIQVAQQLRLIQRRQWCGQPETARTSVAEQFLLQRFQGGPPEPPDAGFITGAVNLVSGQKPAQVVEAGSAHQ